METDKQVLERAKDLLNRYEEDLQERIKIWTDKGDKKKVREIIKKDKLYRKRILNISMIVYTPTAINTAPNYIYSMIQDILEDK